MKRLLNVFLWIGLYGGLGWLVGKYIFGFDILSADHWDVLFDKNLTVWPRHMAPRKLLCKVLLGFIVVGVLGIGIIWKKKRPAKGQPVFVNPKQINTSFSPVKIPSQGKIMAFQPKISIPTPSAGTSGDMPVGTINTQQPSSPVEEQNSFVKTVKQISAEVEPFEATAFPHVKLENTFTHLIISDDSIALLLKILTTSGEWKIQQTPDIAESLWSIGEAEPKKVMMDIINSTKTLARLEPEAECVTVVLLTNGSFQNKEGVLNYFKAQNVRVATLLPENGKIEGIPTWHELLTEYYQEKQKEENVTSNIEPPTEDVEIG